MPLKKAGKCILLGFLIMLMATGCTIGVSVDKLLSPPKLSKEQLEIYAALEKAVGRDIYLIYPKGGEYRSAFVIANIDNEPTDEAIVFYDRETEIKGESNIRINILDNIDGKWQSVYDHAGVGTGIERVLFSTLGDSEDINIIIGYTMLSNEKSVKTYTFTDGILSVRYTDTYSNMFISDMDKNNENELVVLHPNSQNLNAYISFLTRKENEYLESTSVQMNPQTTDFVNIAYGYIGSTTSALFIDGLSNGRLTTEIIYAINGNLRNPVYLSENELIKETSRPSGYLCTDIDNDGVVEIPTTTFFQGYNTDSTEKMYITNWNIFENYSIVKKYTSYYNVSDKYCFILPSRWENVVTARTDKATGDIVFYKFQTDLENSKTELLRFAVADDDKDAENKLASGYTIIKTKDKLNYMMKLPEDTEEPLILTNTEITNNFYIMGK